MRAPAISPASRPLCWALALAALLLVATMTNVSAMADEPIGEPQPIDGDATLAGVLGAAEAQAGNPIAEGAPTLASYLASGELQLSVDMALSDDPEPVVGSFTVDGLTYAVVGEGEVALVAVAPSTLAGGLAGDPADDVAGGSAGGPSDGSSGAEGAGRGIGSGVPTSPQPQPAPSAEASGSEEPEGVAGAVGLAHIAGSAVASLLAEGPGAEDASGLRELPVDAAVDGSAALGAEAPMADGLGPDADSASASEALALLESVEHDGSSYALVAVGPRALAGCAAAAVVLPASVASVDEAAFRGSSVQAIEVAEGNPNFSSYDGMLFSADRTSLLLIPEGKQGAARIPKEAASVPPDAFSHGASVTSVSVETGSAAFSSWNGCLYDASGETLLRVPAGATEISIADGCTTVAAGSLEGCDQLAVIHAPASVVSVGGEGPQTIPVASTLLPSSQGNGTQQICEVLSLARSFGEGDKGLDDAGFSHIEVCLPEGADGSPWSNAGFSAAADAFRSEDGVALSQAALSDGDKSNWTYPTVQTCYPDRAGSITAWVMPDRFEACDVQLGPWVESDGDHGSSGATQNAWQITGGLASNESVGLVMEYQPETDYPVAKVVIRIYAYVRSSSPPNIKWDFTFYCTAKPGVKLLGAKIHNVGGVSNGSKHFTRTYTNSTFANEGLRPEFGDITLYKTGRLRIDLVTELKTYSIPLDLNWDGVSGAKPKWTGPTSVTATYGENMPAIDATHSLPTYYGYTFDGFWTSPELGKGTKYYTYSKDPSNKLVVSSFRAWDQHDWNEKNSDGTTKKLYAQWKPNKHSLSFDADTDDATVSDMPADLKNHGGDDDQRLEFGDYYTLPDSEPTRAGYTFGYWYHDVSNGETTTERSYAAGSLFHLIWDEDITLKAKWVPIKYDIEFWSNDAKTLFMTLSDVEYGKETTFAGISDITVPAGKEARGWATRSLAHIGKYSLNGRYKNLSSTNGATVKLFLAIRSPMKIFIDPSDASKGYFVLYDDLGYDGQTTMGDLTKKLDKVHITGGDPFYRVAGSTETLDSGKRGFWMWHDQRADENGNVVNTVTRRQRGYAYPNPGYEFQGWSLSSAPTEVKGAVEATWSSGSCQMTANFGARTYEVTFDRFHGGGTAEQPSKGDPGRVTATYDADMPSIPASVGWPVRPGYAFSGWYDGYDPATAKRYYRPVAGSSGEELLESDARWDRHDWNERQGATEREQLRAGWDANAYRVAFDAAGGSWEGAEELEPVAAEFDQDVELAAVPERAGYHFDGWEATGPDGKAYVLAAGSTLPKGKLAEGVPLTWAEPGEDGEAPTATLTARWVADLRVDVPISADFELLVNWETGTVDVAAAGSGGAEHAVGGFRSQSSGDILVSAFGQEAGTAAGHRASALACLARGDEAKAGNLSKVSLSLSADADGAPSLSFPLADLYELPESWPSPEAMATRQDLEGLGLVVPAAAGAGQPGTLKVRYGLGCEGLPLEDVAIDATPRPILKLVYEVRLANP